MSTQASLLPAVRCLLTLLGMLLNCLSCPATIPPATLAHFLQSCEAPITPQRLGKGVAFARQCRHKENIADPYIQAALLEGACLLATQGDERLEVLLTYPELSRLLASCSYVGQQSYLQHVLALAAKAPNPKAAQFLRQNPCLQDQLRREEGVPSLVMPPFRYDRQTKE